MKSKIEPIKVKFTMFAVEEFAAKSHNIREKECINFGLLFSYELFFDSVECG